MSTIFAPLTLKGLCSVYVLRISGNKTLECLQKLGIKKETAKVTSKEVDEEITKLLTSKGWKVVRIWECELKNKNRELLIDKIKELIV